MTLERPMFPPRGEAQDSFAALAAAVHPAWHQAVIRLSHSMEEVSAQMTLLLNEPGSMRQGARKVISVLIDYLDLVEGDPDFEEDDREEVGDDEPSLGSFDRMTDQNKSWRTICLWDLPAVDDNEVDDCDREDDDPAEESEPSGIADFDGLYEQVGTQDPQQGSMG